MKASGNGGWSLFRLSDRKQFDRVDLSTIDFFYRALPEALYTDWLMWREGFSGWRPFSELPLILKHLKKQDEVVLAPPVPESILKLADEVTSAGQHAVSPTVEGESKFEISQSHAGFEFKTKNTIAPNTSAKVPSDSAVVTTGFGKQGNTNSQSGRQNTKGFVLPDSDTSARSGSLRSVASAKESEGVPTSEQSPLDSQVENTRSSVSVRALQAAATSSLRLNTVGRNMNVGGAAGTKSDRDSDSPVNTGGYHPAGRVLTMPDEATMSLMLESEAATEDRNNVRYSKKFKVRIFTPKGIITVATIDCSVSGFKLRDPLPEGLPRFFHCEIDLGPEGKIPLICSEVKEKDGRPATRVRIQVNDHLQTFKSALMRAS